MTVSVPQPLEKFRLCLDQVLSYHSGCVADLVLIPGCVPVGGDRELGRVGRHVPKAHGFLAHRLGERDTDRIEGSLP